MSFWTRELRATYAFVERNFNLIKRYWGWEVVWITYSIVNSLAITFIGAGMEKISGQSVDTQFLILYLLVGTLIWSYLSVVFDSVSEMISWERWEGTIEYTFMAPVSRSTHMIGTTLFAVTYGILRTLIILGVVTFFFQINLGKANLVGAMLLLLIGSVSFIGFGIVAAVLPLLFPERGSQMTHVIEALLLLISGIYYPISVLPDWLQAVSMLSPATYVLEHGYCRSVYAVDPDGMIVEFTLDAPHAAQINAIRAKDAHTELKRWLAGDHTSNNDVRPHMLGAD